MSKRYNKSLIKDNYTYNLEQIADLLRVDVVTIRRWISKEGLKRIPKVRPYLVHSSELKTFLNGRQEKRTFRCADNEVPCMSCRAAREPATGSGEIILQPNGCVRLRALCGICGAICYRAIKVQDWSEKHPLAQYIHEEGKQHKGAQPTHRICSIQEIASA